MLFKIRKYFKVEFPKVSYDQKEMKFEIKRYWNESKEWSQPNGSLFQPRARTWCYSKTLEQLYFPVFSIPSGFKIPYYNFRPYKLEMSPEIIILIILDQILWLTTYARNFIVSPNEGNKSRWLIKKTV